MDLEVQYVEAKQYFVVISKGNTVPAEIAQSLNQVVEHPKWEPGMGLMYDNRLENLSELSSPGVQVIADAFLSRNESLTNSKVALVMPQELAYGLARMWQLYTGVGASFVSRVFRSIEEATAWIEQ